MVFLENRCFFMDKLFLKLNKNEKINTISKLKTDIFIKNQII